MKKPRVSIIIVIWLFVLRAMGSYNGLVKADESVKAARAQVESQYQRRADLIPNLVSTVKGYASHEENIFLEVTNARAKAGQTTVTLDDAQSIASYQQAQGEVSSALTRLLAIAENYPDLKANQNFLELQVQLEGTENRIATERMRYNNITKDFNIMIRRFPSNIIANMFGFSGKELFQADQWTDKAPAVDFTK